MSTYYTKYIPLSELVNIIFMFRVLGYSALQTGQLDNRQAHESHHLCFANTQNNDHIPRLLKVIDNLLFLYYPL